MTMSRAIDFGSFVGAQLAALIEAEVEGAEKTAEYIERVGFEKVSEGGRDKLALRMVTFDMKRRDTDGVSRTHTIRVPVLTLIPIPLLTIEEATIDFDLLVEDVVDVEEESRDESTTTGVGRLFARKRNQLKTRVARTSKEQSRTRADLKMTVRIAQSAFPVGIERLLNTADLSVEDVVDE